MNKQAIKEKCDEMAKQLNEGSSLSHWQAFLEMHYEDELVGKSSPPKTWAEFIEQEAKRLGII